MPLKSGKSKATLKSNMTELMTGSMGASRKKGMLTLAREKNMPMAKAKAIQAYAIAKSTQRKSKKK